MRFDLESVLRAMARNAVRLETGEGDGVIVGRFGGTPDVPPDFAWPYFETDTFCDDTVKPRPLSFLAQFDGSALEPLDLENLLPHEGVLSFFYELESQRWGFDPEDGGCARVYWFPDKAVLSPADFPEDMPEYCRLPSLPFRGRSLREYPSYEEFSVDLDLLESCLRPNQSPWEVFSGIRNALRGYDEDPVPYHRLLGWPDIIQNNMTQQCELVRRGHYLGAGWETVTEAEMEEAGKGSLDEWRLLFQLDSGAGTEDFSLDFGDCGSIYFYIRKEDLAARRFDRVWLILQCG